MNLSDLGKFPILGKGARWCQFLTSEPHLESHWTAQTPPLKCLWSKPLIRIFTHAFLESGLGSHILFSINQLPTPAKILASMQVCNRIFTLK